MGLFFFGSAPQLKMVTKLTDYLLVLYITCMTI